MLVINTKTYSKSDLKHSVKIAKISEQLAKSQKKTIILCLQATELKEVNENSRLPLFAQHIDPITPGAHTGYVLAESVAESGAIGTLLNHSEHQIDMKTLKASIARAREANLLVLACATTPKKAAQIAKLEPDMIAIEPPELIGGDISVATARPEIITNTIKAVTKVANIPVLCGAGVKTREDVEIALKLGAKGVLVASGIVKANNVKKEIKELLDGM